MFPVATNLPLLGKAPFGGITYCLEAPKDLTITGMKFYPSTVNAVDEVTVLLGGCRHVPDGEQVAKFRVSDLRDNFIPLEISMAKGELLKVWFASITDNNVARFTLFADSPVDFRRYTENFMDKRFPWNAELSGIDPHESFGRVGRLSRLEYRWAPIPLDTFYARFFMMTDTVYYVDFIFRSDGTTSLGANCWRIRLNPSATTNDFLLIKRVAGADTTVYSEAVDIAAGTWIFVEMIFSERFIVLFRDRVFKTFISDTAVPRGSTVQIYKESSGFGYWAHIEIY